MKWTAEDDARIMPFVEEGLRDIELNGTIPWDDVMRELEVTERKLEQLRSPNTISLRLAKWLGKISRRFVKI